MYEDEYCKLTDLNLNTHKFIYYDIPFEKWKHNNSVFFICAICNDIIQIATFSDFDYYRPVARYDRKSYSCNEILIKNIIE